MEDNWTIWHRIKREFLLWYYTPPNKEILWKTLTAFSVLILLGLVFIFKI